MKQKYHILLERITCVPAETPGMVIEAQVRENLDFGFETSDAALAAAWRMQKDFDNDAEPVTVYVADEANVPIAPAVWALHYR
jgi:hypothetical protein